MDQFTQIANNGLIAMQTKVQEAEALMQVRNLLVAIAQGQLKVVVPEIEKTEPEPKAKK